MSEDTNKNFTFKKFIGDAKIYDIMVGWAVGSRIKDFSDAIFTNIIDPIIDYDWNNDGVSDKKQISNISFDLFGIKFKIGAVLLSFIQVSITIFLIFYAQKE